MAGNGWQVGVDIGGSKLLLAATFEGRRVEHRGRTGPVVSPVDIERDIRGFLTRLDGTLAALGIAVPGLVNATGAIIACDVLPRLVGWHPRETFLDLRCPMQVLNDAEAALLEETHDLRPGATAGLVMAGTAIGAAFLVQGRVLRGACGWAGELGYVPITMGERVSPLDELAGGAALATRLGMDGADLSEWASRGEPAVLIAVREAGSALGLGLAAVINLLNPELLGLGGGALELPGYYEAALESAQRHTVPELWRVCTVRRVRAGAAVVALGAARAATQTMRAETASLRGCT